MKTPSITFPSLTPEEGSSLTRKTVYSFGSHVRIIGTTRASSVNSFARDKGSRSWVIELDGRYFASADNFKAAKERARDAFLDR